jgi:hypothetical protein
MSFDRIGCERVYELNEMRGVPMVRMLSVLLLVGLLNFLFPAAGVAGEGTLAMRPSGSWSVLLSDKELEAVRGGFFGMAFSVFFQGFFDSLGNVTGRLNFQAVNGGAAGPPAINPASADGPPATSGVTVANEQVRLFAGVGNLNGVSGIVQINQVPGSFNVVHNNLFVQIAIINVQNSAALRNLNLSSLLRFQ